MTTGAKRHTIPYDYARCLDSECPLRLTCQRYKKPIGVKTSRVSTFRESPEDDECPGWMPSPHPSSSHSSVNTSST